VRALSTEVIPELVRSGAIDVSFHALIEPGTPTGLPGLRVAPFRQDTLVAICARDHALSTAGRASLSMLAQESFVDLTQERALRKLIDREFSARRLHRKSVCEVGDVRSEVQFVAQGLGIAIVPSVLARAYRESSNLAVLTITDKAPSLARWRICILTRPGRKDKKATTAVDVFLETLAKLSPAAPTSLG